MPIISTPLLYSLEFQCNLILSQLSWHGPCPTHCCCQSGLSFYLGMLWLWSSLLHETWPSQCCCKAHLSFFLGRLSLRSSLLLTDVPRLIDLLAFYYFGQKYFWSKTCEDSDVIGRDLFQQIIIQGSQRAFCVAMVMGGMTTLKA